MSSAAYTRLHRIFKKTTTSKTLKPTSKPALKTTILTQPNTDKKTTFVPLPMSQLTDSLSNLKMFIHKFKVASDIGAFRYSYKYYEEVVNHLAHARQYYYIEQILEHQKRYSLDMCREAFVVRLISLYGKSRMYDHARRMFDEMAERNCPRTVLSANALLNACVVSKRCNEVPELFRELREELEFEPDGVSYNVVIKAFCDMEDTDSALGMMEEMGRNGCECNSYTYNTILNALYRNGKVSEGDKQWEMMKGKSLEPDIMTYNAKLRGLVVDGRTKEGVELLDEMTRNGVSPDVYTYNGLINGFVKEDDLVGVKKWYGEMMRNKIVPDSVTFRIVVAFALKKGDVRFGFELCKEGLMQKLNVGRMNLQGVLDGLVKESAIDEAKELVKLVNESKFIYYKLKSRDL